MKKMNLRSLFLWMFFCGCFFMNGALFAATYDASGTWEMRTSDHYDSCDEMTESLTVDVSINQSGDTFTVSIEGESMTGTISGSSYSFENKYSEDGGSTEEDVVFTLTSSTSGSGTVNWEWADDSYYCYGMFDFTLTRKGSSSSSDDDGDDNKDDDDDDDDEVCFIGASLFGLK